MQFDTLYVALGTSANSKLARMVGANLSDSACIVVDEHQQTTISGLFAAGDIVEGLDQIAVASGQAAKAATAIRSEEHTSELRSLMRISYAVFCLKKKTIAIPHNEKTDLHLTTAPTTKHTTPL